MSEYCGFEFEDDETGETVMCVAVHPCRHHKGWRGDKARLEHAALKSALRLLGEHPGYAVADLSSNERVVSAEDTEYFRQLIRKELDEHIGESLPGETGVRELLTRLTEGRE